MFGRIPEFAETANVKRFREALNILENRGAPESTIMLVYGEVGLGKTRTVLHHAAQKGLPYVRLKPQGSIGWMLSELCEALGHKNPPGRTQSRFDLICTELGKNRRGLIADEIENGLGDSAACIDMLRQIGEETELPIILVGRPHADRALARYEPIWSRISATAPFKPMVPDDYIKVAAAYGLKLEQPAAEAMVQPCAGTMRLGMNLIKRLLENAERSGNSRVGMKELEALL